MSSSSTYFSITRDELLRRRGAIGNRLQTRAHWPAQLLHTGQRNFYLAAVDAELKASDDKPTIGLLLCKDHNRLVAEYALSGIARPIGIAEYQLLRELPDALQKSLPTMAEIEAKLAGEQSEAGGG